MVTKNMAMIDGDSSDGAIYAAHSADNVTDADLNTSLDELGGFESIDDLEEFLAKFTGDEAEVHTQTPSDIDGTPVTAIH